MGKEPPHDPAPEAAALPIRAVTKVATHVRGLDDILQGGIPEGRTSVVAGGPGSGKTMMAMEVLYRYTRAGQPAILLSFEESDAMIRGNALSLGWDLAALEKTGRLAMVHPTLDHNAFQAGEFSIKGLLAILDGKIRATGAGLIVIDALDVLLRLFVDPHRRDQETKALMQWLGERQLTSLFTVKLPQKLERPDRFSTIDYLSDCLIHLDQRVAGQVTTRRMRVLKYRGSGYSSNEHPFIITGEGVVLMPIDDASLNYKPLGPALSAGHPQLDVILGGGYRRGAAVLISGPTGSGKTTLASLFVRSACGQGERVNYVSFEESPATYTAGMRSLQIDLQPFMDQGLLHFRSVIPEALGVEEHLYRLVQDMDALRPRHHILDAVSAARRIGSEKGAFDLMVRLMDACKQRGITCLFTNQTSHRAPVDAISGIGISSLIDTAIVLDFERRRRQLQRTLLVFKSRGTAHSHRIHRVRLADEGLRLDDPPENKVPAGENT